MPWPFANDRDQRRQFAAHGSTISLPAGAEEDQDEVVVRATVSRLVLTIKEPVEIVESDVRNELERRRASAPIETVVPILTERAARHRLRDRPPP